MTARAQQLVDESPAGDDALAWYVKALHVGDLNMLAATALKGQGPTRGLGSDLPDR